jgi:hypothetical protein
MGLTSSGNSAVSASTTTATELAHHCAGHLDVTAGLGGARCVLWLESERGLGICEQALGLRQADLAVDGLDERTRFEGKGDSIRISKVKRRFPYRRPMNTTITVPSLSNGSQTA